MFKCVILLLCVLVSVLRAEEYETCSQENQNKCGAQGCHKSPDGSEECICKYGIFYNPKTGLCQDYEDCSEDMKMKCGLRECYVNDVDNSSSCFCSPGFAYYYSRPGVVICRKYETCSQEWQISCGALGCNRFPDESDRCICSSKLYYYDSETDTCQKIKECSEDMKIKCGPRSCYAKHLDNSSSCYCPQGFFKEFKELKNGYCNKMHPCSEEMLKQCGPRFCYRNEYDASYCFCGPGSIYNPTSDICQKAEICSNDMEIKCGPRYCYFDEEKKTSSCFCNPGFIFNSESKVCQRICENNKCLYGECHPTNDNNYECKCEEGYYGRYCDEKTVGGICENNKCLYGECHPINHNDYECKCEKGYYGRYCDEKSDEDETLTVTFNITKSVVGFLFVLTLIWAYFIFYRLKKKNSSKYEKQNRSGMFFGDELKFRNAK